MEPRTCIHDMQKGHIGLLGDHFKRVVFGRSFGWLSLVELSCKKNQPMKRDE